AAWLPARSWVSRRGEGRAAWRLRSASSSKVGVGGGLGEPAAGPAALRCGAASSPAPSYCTVRATAGRPDAFHAPFSCSPAQPRLLLPGGPVRTLPCRGERHYPEEPPRSRLGPAPAPPRRRAARRVCYWRRGHRRSCGQHAAGDDSTDAIPERNDFLFPEYEILIEPEESDSTDDEQGAVDTSKDAKEQDELGAAGFAGQK
uniref:Uncharacterized protein n=1 Tax=Malurus cyaneus samueli TaxID=2593467 RepID=A0A8C5X990_9PASS